MKLLDNIWTYLTATRLRRHLSFWLGLILAWTVFGTLVIGNLKEPLINKLCYLPSQLIAFYALAYYQVPKLLYPSRYEWFAISFLGVAYFTGVLARFMKVYVYEPVLGIDLPKDPISDLFTQIAPLLSQYLLWVYGMAIFALIVKLLREHFIEKKALEETLTEKTKAELSFLKAQIHPHFLFNTLNNLYTLTLHKSPDAAPTVRKLSGMLDYMFFECQDNRVPISKEINLLQNYIDLELLRYGERLDLSFEQDVDDPNTMMAPLLLLSIVENAFKHGASGDIGRPFIDIDLVLKEEQLSFWLRNSKPPSAQTDETQFKEGIGLKNTRRQLELLYSGHYQLEINDGKSCYEVKLEIDLKQLVEERSLAYETV